MKVLCAWNLIDDTIQHEWGRLQITLKAWIKIHKPLYNIFVRLMVTATAFRQWEISVAVCKQASAAVHCCIII